MCDWAVQTDRAGHQKWESTRKDCFSYIAPIEGDVKHPIFTVWRLLTSDSDVRSRQTKKKRNAKTLAIATHPLSTMRFHRSLGIFVIIFTHFRWYLSQFSTDFHVLLQALSADITATALYMWRSLIKYFKSY